MNDIYCRESKPDFNPEYCQKSYNDYYFKKESDEWYRKHSEKEFSSFDIFDNND